jgi:hypothetical protein
MKPYNETKIVIIGMGYLMEYLLPCHRKFLGTNLAGNVVAVTADEADIPRKRAAAGFEVVLNDNLGTLRRVRPDIVFFAPPPSLAPKLTEEALVPYYRELRKNGEPLPDLYAFPPNPAGDYYLSMLGGDIHVVNILPNMVTVLGDRDVSQEGYSNVTFPKKAPWKKENRDRLEAFFAPIGDVVEVGPDYVIPMLAGCVVCHNISEVIFSVSDGMTEGGFAPDFHKIAGAMRHYHQKAHFYDVPGSLPCGTEGLDGKLLNALEKTALRWYAGIEKFYGETRMDEKLTREILVPQLDLHLQAHQLEEREVLEKKTRQHATKGGVLEMGCRTFTERYDGLVRGAFKTYPAFAFDDTWCSALEEAARIITKTVSDHGYTLSKKKGPEFNVEHHAVLFGLYAKYAKQTAGKKGLDAVGKAVSVYGAERGTRMAKRTKRDGLPLTMENYLAYGEWTAKPGQMEMREKALAPVYTTAVTRCEWNESWKKNGLAEFGPIYCRFVDHHLVKGYSDSLELAVDSFLSEGAAECLFTWNGADMGGGNKEAFMKKKASFGMRNAKDFRYHAAHLSAVMKRVLKDELGTEADKIAVLALKEFSNKFGPDFAEAVADGEKTDFNAI